MRLLITTIALVFFLLPGLSQKPKQYYKAAEEFLEAGNKADAIEQFSKAIELDPEYTEAYIQRGKIYFEQEKYQASLEDYTRALTFEPEEPNVLLLKTTTLFALQQYNKALESANKLIEIDKKNIEGYQLKIETLIKLEDYNAALYAANELNDMRETPENLYLRGKVNVLLGNLEDAREDLSDAISKDKKYIDAYVAYTNLMVQTDNITEAEEHIAKAIELNPKNPQAYLARSKVFISKLQYTEAINDISKNILIEPNNPQWYLTRGNYYLDYAQYQSAISDFSKVIDLDKDNATALYKRAYGYEQIHDFKKAMKDYENLTALSKYDAKAQELLDEAEKRLFELNRENDSPVITIKEPLPVEANKLNIAENKTEITIKGSITDDSKISSLNINNQAVKLIETLDGYEFHAAIPVNNIDQISITATDVYNNVQNLSMAIQRTEINAPLVQIMAPIASDNGEIYLDTKASSLYIEGVIEDESKIKSIFVDGVSASYRLDEEDPKFSATIDILNKNKFLVEATDIYGNTTQQEFSFNREAIELSENNPMGKTWVVFIENSNYETFASLEGPVKDVSMMKGALANYKIHNFIVKKDMTKKQLEKFFAIELRDWVRSNRVNSLLVWYAGHGKFVNETGYWIPVDAQRDDEFTYFNINALRASLQAYTSTITHTLVITDACESGPTFYQAMRSANDTKSCNDWTATKAKSSQVFSSAGYELAVDNSQFTRTFAGTLEANPNACIPIDDIVERVTTAVTSNNQQKPKFGKIAGLEDEGGTFFFIQKD